MRRLISRRLYATSKDGGSKKRKNRLRTKRNAAKFHEIDCTDGDAVKACGDARVVGTKTIFADVVAKPQTAGHLPLGLAMSSFRSEKLENEMTEKGLVRACLRP